MCRCASSRPRRPLPTAPPSPARVTAPGGAPGVYSVDYLYPSTQLDPAVYPVDGQLGFFVWRDLNPAQGRYDWEPGMPGMLPDWIMKQADAGLRAAIMVSTYDGSDANDIRSTPNWVIKLPDAVLPVTLTNGLPHYIDYYHRRSSRGLNGEFDLDAKYWTISDTTAITLTKSAPHDDHVSETATRPDRPASGPALRLGGANNVDALITHDPEQVPAMPASLAGQTNAYVTARVNIVTTDPNPNDHLYLEVMDADGNRLGNGAQVDVANTAHAGRAASYWQEYQLDITPFALEKNIRVAFRVATDAANPTTFYVDNVQLRVRHLIPKYWSDSYKQAYKQFITALGARYRATPAGADPRFDLAYVAIGTGVYGESQPTQDNPEWEYGTTFDHVVKNAGLDTTQKWQAWVNEITAAYATAFASAAGSPPVKPLLLQFAPTFIDPEEKGYTTDYAAGLGVGLSYNRLIPEWVNLFRNNRAGGYDPMRLYWGKVPTAYEGDNWDLGCSPVLTYWAVWGAVARHVDYLRVAPDLLQDAAGRPTVHNAPFAWARPYIGKTVQSAPRVWTILREHRNPAMQRCGYLNYDTDQWGSTYPEYGNFNYWLAQDDTIAGGRTVAETNDKGADRRYAKDPATGNANTYAGLGNCPPKAYGAIYNSNPPVCNPEPYNPNLPALKGQDPANYKDYYNPNDWTGEGKEAYVVRRTDQAGANPFMFFRIDDGYIGAGRPSRSVKFTIGYFDIGMDRWSLRYHSTAGEKVAGTVTKGGTKAYKEISFTVNDAALANGLTGGADFSLDSRAPDGTADGDEWVHQVTVERLDAPVGGTETPTPSPTPTQTLSPTGLPSETPTATATVTPAATVTATATVRPDPIATPEGVRLFLPVIRH